MIQQSHNDSSSTTTVVHQCTAKPTGFVFPLSSWILDSGATDHICPFKSLFQNLKPISPISIQLPNQNSVIAKFSGTIVLGNLILHNTLFVPEFSVQLIAIPKLLNSTNCLMVFSQNTCFIVQTDTFQPIGAARKHQGLFYLLDSSQDRCNLSISNINISLPHSTLINNASPSNLWHMKLGHPSNQILQLLVSDHSDIFSPFIIACDACAFFKQKRLKYSSSTSKSLQFFELIHVDIWGPISVSSINGYKYFLTIVDDYSRFTWILFLKNKTEVRSLLQDFINLNENQFSCKLKIIRFGNGKEFLLYDFHNSKGIFHETSCDATPQ